MEGAVPDRARLAAAAAVVAVLAVAGCGTDKARKHPASEPVLTTAKPPPKEPGKFNLHAHPKVVQLEGAGSQPKVQGSAADNGPSPGAPSDSAVRAELKQGQRDLRSFKQYLSSDAAFLPTGPRARVARDGMAIAPDNAPDVVKRVILAGNQIAKFPYKWGGGHGAWRDTGYDCSGSVSFALAGAGLLRAPLASGGFLKFGAPGRGKWITIFTNEGHIFMFVAGLRFDTSGQGRAGTRWQEGTRSTAGFAERHIPGL